MKIFLVLSVIFLGIHLTAAVTHSLKYFYTASSGLKAFPQFVTVGLVDDQPFTYYDSVIRRETPKQDWMAENVGPEYWERNTQVFIGTEQTFKADIDIVKQRFNQTGGVHIVQFMYGCEWDDETQQVKGYGQYGYDGEDWLVLDTESNTWIAPKQQAEISTNKWNNDRAQLEGYKNYLNQICPEWLKKYVDYGRSSLTRTGLPSVSFLQKSSSSPVSCHATGFYPSRAEMFWRKDGDEVHDGVVKGEILPNNDGSFQMSVDIDLSSVAAEHWPKYECVFQLSGTSEDITHRLEKTRVLTNESNTNITYVIIAVVVTVAVLGLIGLIGFILYKKKNGRKPPVTEDIKSSASSLSSDKSDDSRGSGSSDDSLDSASSDKPLLQREVKITK